MNLTGYKTIIVGLLMTVCVPALSYLEKIDWTALGVSPVVAIVISGIIMLALRYVTTTPITKPDSVASVAAMPDAALHKAGVVKILTATTDLGVALANETSGNVVTVASNPNPQSGVGRAR